MDTTIIKGLRAARLDRVFDALESRTVAAEPHRRKPRRRAVGQMPSLALRFLPTV